MTYPEPVQSMHSHEEEIYFLTKNDDNRYSLRVQRFREDSPQVVYMDQQESLTLDAVQQVLRRLD